MGPIEALRLALSKEIEAMQLYQRLSSEAPAAKETLLFLVNEEQKHKSIIEQKMSDMTR